MISDHIAGHVVACCNFSMFTFQESLHEDHPSINSELAQLAFAYDWSMKKVWNEQLVPSIFGTGRFTCPGFGYPLCNNISIIISSSVSHRLQLHVDITHTHSHTQNIDTTACKGIQYHQTQNPCPDIFTAVTNFLGFLVQIWVSLDKVLHAPQKFPSFECIYTRTWCGHTFINTHGNSQWHHAYMAMMRH
jgi:hypothetical protein